MPGFNLRDVFSAIWAVFARLAVRLSRAYRFARAGYSLDPGMTIYSDTRAGRTGATTQPNRGGRTLPLDIPGQSGRIRFFRSIELILSGLFNRNRISPFRAVRSADRADGVGVDESGDSVLNENVVTREPGIDDNTEWSLVAPVSSPVKGAGNDVGNSSSNTSGSVAAVQKERVEAADNDVGTDAPVDESAGVIEGAYIQPGPLSFSLLSVISRMAGMVINRLLVFIRAKRIHLRWIAISLLIAFVIYIVDVWMIGSISMVVAATQAWMLKGMRGLPDYTWGRHFFYGPLGSSFDLILGKLPPAVIADWLRGNIFFIPVAVVLVTYVGRILKKTDSLRFSSDPSRGTANWMDAPHLSKVLRTGSAGGLIFGRDIQTGKVLYMPPSNDEKNRLNSHVAVFGSSGSMKSRAYIMNNILQATMMNASVIVTDSKGMLYNKCAAFLESEGYVVKVFNTVNMLNSDRWNLLGEVKSDLDAQLMTDIIIANTTLPGGAKGKSDAFWVQGEMGLIKALSLYCITENPKDRQNMGSYYSMITTGIPTYLDGLFTGVKPSSPARLSYNIFLQSPEGVRNGIISGMGNRLQIFQNELVRAFTATSDIDLSLPGRQKCAYFCIMPDYHSAYDYLSSLFFSFLFIRLIELADSQPGMSLQVPVYLLLDEFPNVAGISDFKKKLATIRSRNMHASIVFQDLSQLEDRYPNKGWTGIIGNCDWRLFLGANDQETARFVETLLGKGTVTTQSVSKYSGIKGWLDSGSETTRPESRNLMNLDEVLRLPLDEAILLIRGHNPLRLKKMDYSQHPLAGSLIERDINDYLPPWAREVRDGLQPKDDGVYIPPPAAPVDRQKRNSGKKPWKEPATDNNKPFFPKPVG